MAIGRCIGIAFLSVMFTGAASPQVDRTQTLPVNIEAQDLYLQGMLSSNAGDFKNAMG
jgi:hypothetical protein